jgi:hypothetical protein
MAVAPNRIQIEKIDGTHFSDTELQAPGGNSGGERQRIARGFGRLATQGDGKVQHHP